MKTFGLIGHQKGASVLSTKEYEDGSSNVKSKQRREDTQSVMRLSDVFVDCTILVSYKRDTQDVVVFVDDMLQIRVHSDRNHSVKL